MTPGQRFRHENSIDRRLVSTWQLVAVTKRYLRFAVEGQLDPFTGRPLQRCLTPRQAEKALADGRLQVLA